MTWLAFMLTSKQAHYKFHIKRSMPEVKMLPDGKQHAKVFSSGLEKMDFAGNAPGNTCVPISLTADVSRLFRRTLENGEKWIEE